MRVVVDANVAIAAVATRGLCEAILELCLEQHQLVLCEGILDEIEAKLRDKLHVPPPITADFLRILRGNAEIIEPELAEEGACRDPGDLMILGLVAPGNVDAIVIGDRDLLVIGQHNHAWIMSPRSFWQSNTAGA